MSRQAFQDHSLNALVLHLLPLSLTQLQRVLVEKWASLEQGLAHCYPQIDEKRASALFQKLFHKGCCQTLPIVKEAKN